MSSEFPFFDLTAWIKEIRDTECPIIPANDTRTENTDITAMFFDGYVDLSDPNERRKFYTKLNPEGPRTEPSGEGPCGIIDTIAGKVLVFPCPISK